MQYRLFTRAYLFSVLMYYYMLSITKGYLSDFDAILQEDLKLKYIPIHFLAECKSCFKSQQHLWLDAWSNHVLSNASYWSEIIAPCFYRPSWVRQSTVSASLVRYVARTIANSTRVLSQAVVQSTQDLRHHRLCPGTFSHVRPVLQVIKCNLGQIIDNYSEHKVNQLANNIRTIENQVNLLILSENSGPSTWVGNISSENSDGQCRSGRADTDPS